MKEGWKTVTGTRSNRTRCVRTDGKNEQPTAKNVRSRIYISTLFDQNCSKYTWNILYMVIYTVYIHEDELVEYIVSKVW